MSIQDQTPEFAILKAFETHSLVAIGDYHWAPSIMEAVTNIVTNPELTQEVQHIVVEFGNARHQDLLDGYLAGDEMSEQQLAQVYRDALYFTAWMPTVYHDFFKAVRAHNLTADKAKQIKVTLAEKPFYWEQVTDNDVWKRAASTKVDGFISRISQAIESHEKTLFIFGAFHLLKLPNDIARIVDKSQLPMMSQLEQKYPQQTFTIWPLTNPKLINTLSSYKKPSVITTSSDALKALPFIDFLPKAARQLATLNAQELMLHDLADAVLYVGEAKVNYQLPKSVLADETWIQELGRRLEIMGGKLKVRYEEIIESSYESE
ncbi:hypothetical protein EOL70_20175 [Leucothrix sargassi]|nr:hypothetical protein EOL70_20175 [Leucothrix sargassi]